MLWLLVHVLSGERFGSELTIVLIIYVMAAGLYSAICILDNIKATKVAKEIKKETSINE